MFWEFAVWLLPALVIASISRSIEIGHENFVVVERFGKRRILFRGRHMLIIGIDYICTHGTLGAQRLDLYACPDAPRMKFRDEEIPIEVTVHYELGNHLEVALGHWERVTADIERWLHRANRERHIFSIVDAHLRRQFEDKTVAEARIVQDCIIAEVAHAIEEDLRKLGMRPPRGRRRLTVLFPIPENEEPPTA